MAKPWSGWKPLWRRWKNSTLPGDCPCWNGTPDLHAPSGTVVIVMKIRAPRFFHCVSSLVTWFDSSAAGSGISAAVLLSYRFIVPVVIFMSACGFLQL